MYYLIAGLIGVAVGYACNGLIYRKEHLLGDYVLRAAKAGEAHAAAVYGKVMHKI